jgi:hypothetical protein
MTKEVWSIRGCVVQRFAFLLLLTLFYKSVSGGTLEVVVVDSGGGALPTRILVRPVGGECVVPDEAVVLEIGADRWFMSPGASSVQVPDGRVLLRVEHGLEYQRFKEEVVVEGPTAKKTVALKRWVNMRELGYRSGENHLHVGSIRLAPMLAAEGLDFGTSMTWWNGPDSDWCLPVPPGQGRSRLLEFSGTAIPTSVYDAEIEHGWGAAYFLHLPAPMPIRSDPKRPNLEFVQHVNENGGLVFYQGGWSRQVVVDALLGLVHGVNVCNNNFHLHRFQPRSRYSNLLEVDGFPTYPDTDLGMMDMNTETYYRLLNWGLKLAAGAGSATGFKQVPVGYNRTYVRAAREITLPEFYDAWAQGNNFVTNGPMLFLKAGPSNRPGDTIALPSEGGVVPLRVEVLSDQPLLTLELIVNGEVVADFPVSGKRKGLFEHQVEIDRGSWIAARCRARDTLLTDGELAAYANGEREQPSRLRYAHTSPVYVTVGGKLAAVRKSIEEGLRMLDQFELYTRETADPRYREDMLAAVAEARTKLTTRLE